ncbi:MAG: hypothetical protein U9O94_00990 [Nanoarchaeota archaeon]|nr:hypothetical protein [Nanoarchaeota archaeon]
MKVLNLIVHEEYLKIYKCQSQLDRINQIKSDPTQETYEIPWSVKIEKKNSKVQGAIGLCKRYDLVILHGFSRYACLANMSDYIIEQGVSTAYDIEGTK